MKTIQGKLQLDQLGLLWMISMNLNMFFNLCWIWSKKTSASSFYKENNLKPCLTKELLNMFRLWWERGNWDSSPLKQISQVMLAGTKLTSYWR